ncbi:beta-1,3-glucan-binding protein 1-like isoform X2 [Thrips palmi]|uniref:Beta-1,3-glucan-binding protein 1-like isoform X2 n=1 Tax=Thrips palmi TaxID=161013 RepID=A0A6P8YR53_THRPL|nr:beta-1,3-glucan-binding protein 1-like isoform X2 [Thrips palmi]
MPPRAVTERPAAPRRRAAPGVNTSLLACCACFPTCLLLFLASASVVTVAAQDVDVPVPTFEAFHPKGLRVSIPDIDGLEIFAFHGNVNKPLHNLEAGEMSVDVTAKKAGRWEYFNENRRLKAGDVINYWVWIQVDRKGYQRLGLSHRITELVPLGVDSQSNALRPEARPVLTMSLEDLLESLQGQQGGQSGQGASDLESRPTQQTQLQEQYRPRPQRPSESRPSNPYDSRPSTGGSWSPGGESTEYRPPPGDYRPPPGDYRPPPGDYRPPPGDYRPPAGGNRPPPDEYRPPAGGNRPPPDEYRPKPSEYRPPGSHYGARPPPPPTYNHEYPPPPPVAATVVHVSHVQHNHHVGFASGEDNHGQGQERPTNNVYPSQPNYPVDRPTQPTHQGLERPTTGPTDYEPTLAAVSPTTWWQGGSNQGGDQGANQGAVPAGLPLTPGDRVSEPPPAARPGRPTGPTHTCELSATHVNGRPACKGEVVFEENWNSLDRRKWSHEVKISGSPDFEFCIYAQHPENTFVKNGWLHLKASLTNDKYGDDFVRKGNLQLEGCTAGPLNSESCSREAMFSYILPPVVASRLTTKNSFSFKYGKVEVRARLPRGDWMYPEVWLQPLREEYGAGLASGRIHLAMARGNTKLQGPAPGRQDISGRELAVGVLAGGKGTGSADARKKFFTKRNDVGHWGADFHNYSLLWTPDTLAFSVDGVELGVARPEEVGGLLRGQDNEGDDPWSHGSKIAPFDKEFYISLGLAVGGIHAFPDGCRSGNHDKPWKNTAAKAMLSFWNAREVWHSTWNGQQAELLVESVRVTALNN